jgi:hypothetical protein
LSSKLKNHPYYYQYNHEEKMFSAIIFQLRVVSTKRFLRRLGVVKRDDFNGILNAVTEFLQGK